MERPAIDYDGELAQAYEQGRSISPAAEATWRAAVTPFLAGSSLVLDVGAGTGRFARLLASEVPGRVVAVEPAAGMRAAAPGPDSSVDWVGGSAEHIPFADHTASAIWTAFTTHYLDLPAAAEEFSRVLQRNGVVLVWHAFEDVFDELEWYRWFPSARAIDEARMPTFDDVCGAFEGGGFDLVERSTHSMLLAADLTLLADRLANRALSTLKLIPDAEFDDGIARLRAFARTAPRSPVYSPNVLVAFKPQ